MLANRMSPNDRYRLAFWNAVCALVSFVMALLCFSVNHPGVAIFNLVAAALNIVGHFANISLYKYAKDNNLPMDTPLT